MARQLESLLRDFFANEELAYVTGATSQCLSLAVIADAPANGLSAAESQHAADCRHCLRALSIAFRSECPSQALLAAFSEGRSPIGEAIRNHIELDHCESCRAVTVPAPELRSEPPRRFGRRFIPLLAAAAILILALGVRWIMSRQRAPEVPAGETVMASLMDNAGQVILTQSGSVLLPDRSLPPGVLLASVKDLLTNGLIQQRDRVPSAAARAAKDLVERGPSGEPAEDPILVSPVGTAVRSTRPAFSWRPVQGATHYTLYLTDHNRKLVWQGSSGTATSLTLPPQAPELVRGEAYLWQVEALVRDDARLSRWDSFAVLDTAGLQSAMAGEKLYADSALLLGALYERQGLYDDAEREFRKLSELNPSSPLPGKMLASLQELRQRP
jgi:hypothetical protein